MPFKNACLSLLLVSITQEGIKICSVQPVWRRPVVDLSFQQIYQLDVSGCFWTGVRFSLDGCGRYFCHLLRSANKDLVQGLKLERRYVANVESDRGLMLGQNRILHRPMHLVTATRVQRLGPE